MPHLGIFFVVVRFASIHLIHFIHGSMLWCSKIIPCISSIGFQLLLHKDEGSFVSFLGNRVVN